MAFPQARVSAVLLLSVSLLFGASISASRPRQEPAHIDRLSGERVSGGLGFR